MAPKKNPNPQTLFKRLTRLFRSGPVVKRKIRSKDTAIAVPDRTKSSGTLLFQKSMSPTYATITANAYNLSERLMRYQDFQEMEYTPEIAAAMDIYADESVAQDDKGRVLHIFSENERIKELLEDLFYNTLNVEFNLRSWVRNLPVRKNSVIPLLDGRNITIEELAREYEAGKENWVYSIQDDTHRMVPGKINWCGLTKNASQLVRVWLDNETYVDCTPDHEWVMRDGSSKKAEDLQHNDSLMPLYRNVAMMHCKQGYERVYNPETSQFQYTHRLMVVHRWKRSDVGKIVHHVNFNRYDNTPGNLCVMTKEEHIELHRRIVNSYNSSALYKEHNKQCSQAMKKLCADPERKQKVNISSYVDLVRDRLPRIAETPWFKRAEKKSERMSGMIPPMREYHSSAKVVYKNHKVDRVEKLAETDDVYCMEVLGPEGEHDRHNFGIVSYTKDGKPSKSSIISANCKYGDFFLYNDVSPTEGVVNAFPIPVNEIEREENYDRDDPFAVRFRWVTLGNRILENWEVSHFRLLGNDLFLPYGSSVIEPGRRIWRQLILIEDAMLVYRVVRAPERRVFYIDIANVPPEEVPNYMEQQKNNLRASQVIDKNTGRVDLRYNPLPVHRDTPIPMLDGRTVTIEQLAREWEQKHEGDLWVYSVQDKTNKLVPGKVEWCGKNYTATHLVKVWLDNKSYVMTAPEHPFVLRDGTSKRADELIAGDSLMPLYRKESDKGYELCYDPASESYVKTHKWVARDLDPEKWASPPYRTVHHKNPRAPGNKKNNTSEAHRRITSVTNKRRNSVKAMELYNHSDLHKEHVEIRRIAQKKSWSDPKRKSERKKAMQWILPDSCVEIARKVLLDDPTLNRDRLFNRLMDDAEFIREFKCVNKLKRPVSKFNVRTFTRKLPGSDFTEFKKSTLGDKYKRGLLNHSVLAVEHVTVEGDDVYCMTVMGPKGENDRHNFAVCGLKPSTDGLTNITQVDGVIIKNSIDEDYFIPVRGSESGTKIETLAGGQNTAAVEDVAYIQKKLFAALKIPRAYLGYDDMLSCVVPETPVDLLDGRTLTLVQVKEELEASRHVWVYSVDQETNELKPGRVLWAGPTRNDAELVRVTLDNGMAFETTPDHKWMLRDGSWAQACELQPGTPLMPVYRRKKSLQGGSDYEQVFDPSSGKWVWTHQLVADRTDIEMHPSALQESTVIIRHRSANRFDNSPENLLKMGADTHRSSHPGDDLLGNTLQKTNASAPGSDGEHHPLTMQALISWCQVALPNSKRDITKGCGLSEIQFQRLLAENSMTYEEFESWYVSDHESSRLGRTGNSMPVPCTGQLNHRVVSVVPLQEHRDTWCMEVAGTHNFGLSNSVIISNSKATLAQEDIRFSRSINVIQKTVLAELNKLAIIHLFANGFTEDDLVNFQLHLSNPSTVAQQQKLEIWRTKFEIAASMPDGFGSQPFVYRNIWGLSNDDIDKIHREQVKDKVITAQLETIGGEGSGDGGGTGGGGTSGAGGGLDDLFGGGGGGGDTGGDDADLGDVGGGGDEDAADKENAGDEPMEEEDPDLELLTGGDDPDEDEFPIKLPSASDDESPIKAVSYLKNVLYNRSRRRTHGASKTHMPDFGKMTSDFESLDDPYDNDWIKQTVSNPLGERVDVNPGISKDLVSTLSRLSADLHIEPHSQYDTVLTEELDYQDEIDTVVSGSALAEDADIDFEITND